MSRAQIGSRHGRGRGPGQGRRTAVPVALAVCVVLAAGTAPAAASRPGDSGDGRPGSAGLIGFGGFEIQRLDGSGNNRGHPDWGVVGAPYLRVAPATYLDGVGEPVSGPASRLVSNRVFNDTGQPLFSERGTSQWAVVWGQFLDHTFGLRSDSSDEHPIPLDPSDPLEDFTSDLGFVPFSRSSAAPGTGVDSPREQPNIVSSYIDAWAVSTTGSSTGCRRRSARNRSSRSLNRHGHAKRREPTSERSPGMTANGPPQRAQH